MWRSLQNISGNELFKLNNFTRRSVQIQKMRETEKQEPNNDKLILCGTVQTGWPAQTYFQQSSIKRQPKAFILVMGTMNAFHNRSAIIINHLELETNVQMVFDISYQAYSSATEIHLVSYGITIIDNVWHIKRKVWSRRMTNVHQHAYIKHQHNNGLWAKQHW